MNGLNRIEFQGIALAHICGFVALFATTARYLKAWIEHAFPWIKSLEDGFVNKSNMHGYYSREVTLLELFLEDYLPALVGAICAAGVAGIWILKNMLEPVPGVFYEWRRRS